MYTETVTRVSLASPHNMLSIICRALEQVPLSTFLPLDHSSLMLAGWTTSWHAVEEETGICVNNWWMQRSISAEGRRRMQSAAWSLHGCAFRVGRTEQGTKAERAGQNNGPPQMPCYVTGLFEFTIVKATIVGEGLSSCSLRGG